MERRRGWVGSGGSHLGDGRFLPARLGLRADQPGRRTCSQLVLSGRRERGVELPEDALWLGCRPAEQTPHFLNSLNLALVLQRSSSFGDYLRVATNAQVVDADGIIEQQPMMRRQMTTDLSDVDLR